MTGIAGERDRILALLAPARRRPGHRRGPDGRGRRCRRRAGARLARRAGARLGVPVLGYADAAAAQERLRGYAAQTGLTVETAVNGDLLLWAVAPGDDEKALARIDGLAGSFSGRE